MSKRRTLVIANETIEGSGLHEAICYGAEVRVVAPALNSRLRYWLSDEDAARRAAETRLGRFLERLHRAGIEASGRVGDADPLLAIEDELRVFPADEIVISTHPEGRSSWLAHDLVDRACERFDLPVLHVVADSRPGGSFSPPGLARAPSARESPRRGAISASP
jgi:hypothetical protein